MRAIITGQVGMEKKDYLEKAVRLGSQHGVNPHVYHVGNLMYAEAPDVKSPRILDLPLSRLNTLRRAVMRDIISDAAGKTDVIVNTHATFRWRHGLFAAFDFDQVRELKPDTLICLVDNVEVVHHRLSREHTIDASLKDLMVWREEEIMATELLARALDCYHRFFILSRGRYQDTIQTCLRLVTRPDMIKVYPSFPMTHVVDMPEVLDEINAFRRELSKYFIAFDPGDVDEKLLLERAVLAARDGRDFIEAEMVENDQRKTFTVSVKQILDIAGDIDGQIYMRDFKLIDQSDMIVSLIPELPGGLPALSSGVERELHHAFEHGKEVYVIWKPTRSPSPFITETATKVFQSTAQALEYFDQKGMFAQMNLFSH